MNVVAAGLSTRPGWLARLPRVTIAIILVNVLVFLVASDHVLGLPLWLALGANSQLIARGQWYRLVTANVLHVAWDPLIINMAGLLAVGWVAERRLTGRLLALVYVVSGASAVAAAFVLESCADRFGASAAVYGVLGGLVGYLLAQALRSRRLAHPLPYVLVVTGLVLASELLLAPPNVDRLAHLWGLCAGTVLGLSVLPTPRRSLVLAGAAAGIVALSAGLVAWRLATFACGPQVV